ncbi:hypothetical protein SLS55_010228 [Diplodia seriata]|uniref:HNH nuclease domain-containing protein n=1 Tax=Diplodia seriata TaxID=420778 RepID=A0ABR3BXY7_9PEZI
MTRSVLAHKPYVLACEPGILTYEPGMVAHEPSVLSVLAHKPCGLAHEPWILAHEPNEPWILAREPLLLAHEPGAPVLAHKPSLLAHEPGVLTCEPGVLAYEPWILAQKPWVLAHTSHASSFRITDIFPLHPYVSQFRIAQTSIERPETQPVHLVQIFHPGYKDDAPLLTFHAPECGLHHATALTACQIVANNRWDGFLSSTRTGAPVTIPLAAQLRGSAYYFHVPNTPDYAVVPRFRDWHFPHGDPPPAWSTFRTSGQYSSLSHNLGAGRDHRCRLSGAADALALAHVVPQSERAWFFANCMNKYVGDAARLGFDAMGDAANQMLLRTDLGALFDQGYFVFGPLDDPHADGAVSALVLAPSEDFVAQWQGRQLAWQHGVAAEFLLARFAWAVFWRVTPFLTNGVRRELTARDEENDNVYVTRTFNGRECAALVVKPPEMQYKGLDDDEMDGDRE